jgi:hypothetical protein
MKLRIVGTANRRISNPPEAEMMKGGIAALSHFRKIIMIAYLTSTFIIPCLQSAGGGFDTYSPPEEDSLFAFSKFLFRLNWPLFRPEATLI